ncbi:MAG TPA: SDR family oxidoreductase [Gemmatimonadaceae bacterium]|nr:SDR family oxidoreductase [Gemmatimonadaceae bacterium]
MPLPTNVQTDLPPRYQQLLRELAAQPKTWLVTGIAGFIGSNLMEVLLDHGQTVVGIDNFATGHRHNVDAVLAIDADYARRFRFVEGDIRDIDACRTACAGVDYVLHQAALGSVPRSIRDPITSAQVNVDGFLNMIVAARDASVKRFVYASSSSVYGDERTLPQVEEKTGRPLSPYAATKVANEMFAGVFQRTYGLETIGLRYFNVFGPRQDPNGAYAAVIPRWIASLMRGQPCHIFGDGMTSRDFCHIANAVQANLLAALARSDATATAYNVACNESTSLNELFVMLRDAIAVTRPDVRDATPVHDPFRPGDIAHSRADIGKGQRALGYEPIHRVADGVPLVVDWYLRESDARSPQQAD